MKIVVGFWNSPAWKAGRTGEVLDMIRAADTKGIHGFSTPDHIIMSENVDAYPYAPSAVPPSTYFYEPLTLLAAAAAVTSRIRLSTNIIVLPVRSAIFAAKQIATLDVLSGGRLSLGVGVGWQKEEYDATGTPWERRFGYIDEQIRICRALWSRDAVSHHGEFISFDALTARPRPTQGAALPIHFGVGPTPRQFRRIAELGQGWLPDPVVSTQPDALRGHVEALRDAFVAAGRGGEPIEIGAHIRPIYRRESDRLPDLEATLDRARELEAAGATSCYIYPFNYIDEVDGLDRVLATLAGFQGEPGA